MWKILALTFSLSITLPLMASAAPEPNYVCWMQDETGAIINLSSSLCRQNGKGNILAFNQAITSSIQQQGNDNLLLYFNNNKIEEIQKLGWAACDQLRKGVSFSEIRLAQLHQEEKITDRNQFEIIQLRNKLVNILAPKYLCPDLRGVVRKLNR